MASASPFTVIVLAAQRTGVVNPLAQRAGVSHKCLVPICGKPLIAHVLDTLTAIPNVGKIKVSVEPDVHDALTALFAGYASSGVPIELVPSCPGIADSVLTSAVGEAGPFVITTADNVLLTAEAVEGMRAAMETADVVAGLATQASIQAVHKDAQHNFYQFRDGGYSNCNLYGVAGPHAFRAAEVFREGGQFMKNPKRLITAFGLLNILLVRFKLVTVHGAMKLASRRFKLLFKAVIFPDGRLAVDVDNERTYGIAEMLLAQRLAAKET